MNINFLLDLNFLQTCYIQIIKNNTFRFVIGSGITLLLMLIWFILYKTKIEHLCRVLFIISAMITGALCAALLLESILYIPAITAAYLKIYAIKFFGLHLEWEIVLNIAVSFISCYFYAFIVSILIERLKRKSKKREYISKDSEINEDATHE